MRQHEQQASGPSLEKYRRGCVPVRSFQRLCGDRRTARLLCSSSARLSRCRRARRGGTGMCFRIYSRSVPHSSMSASLLWVIAKISSIGSCRLSSVFPFKWRRVFSPHTRLSRGFADGLRGAAKPPGPLLAERVWGLSTSWHSSRGLSHDACVPAAYFVGSQFQDILSAAYPWRAHLSRRPRTSLGGYGFPCASPRVRGMSYRNPCPVLAVF